MEAQGVVTMVGAQGIHTFCTTSMYFSQMGYFLR